ncbi:MAG: hypothetical protein M3443_07905 [Actinomycetota bacterium]|nr:hypothetical protein [Actinomycetota bacterium]
MSSRHQLIPALSAVGDTPPTVEEAVTAAAVLAAQGRRRDALAAARNALRRDDCEPRLWREIHDLLCRVHRAGGHRHLEIRQRQLELEYAEASGDDRRITVAHLELAAALLGGVDDFDDLDAAKHLAAAMRHHPTPVDLTEPALPFATNGRSPTAKPSEQ